MFGLVKFTDACNMACRYCCMGDLAHSTTMPLASAQKVIEIILVYYATLSCPEKDICFHGGEPSILGADYLRELWEQIHEKDPAITISMQSNMYNISDELINAAKKNGVKISTSLDGPKEIHDISRVDRAGNGNFERIMKNLQKCKDAGISLGVICTLNSYNWDKAKELYSFFKDLAIPYKINWVHKIGNGVNPIIYLSNDQVAEAVIGMLNEFLKDENPQIYDDTSSEFLLGVMSGKMVSCAMQGHCQKEFFCIESNGDVYPCDAFSYLPGAKKYCYGNIIDKGLAVFANKIRCSLQERDASCIPLCSTCENREICNAGCLLDADPNDFLKTKSSFCAAYKKIFEYCRAVADTQLRPVINLNIGE